MQFDTRRNSQNFLFDQLNQGDTSTLDAAATELGHNLDNVNGLAFCLCSFTDYMVNRSEHNDFYASLVNKGQQFGKLTVNQWKCVIKDLLKSKIRANYAI